MIARICACERLKTSYPTPVDGWSAGISVFRLQLPLTNLSKSSPRLMVRSIAERSTRQVPKCSGVGAACVDDVLDCAAVNEAAGVSVTIPNAKATAPDRRMRDEKDVFFTRKPL